MSNPILLSCLFCFFSALSEGVFCCFNVSLNSGPIFVKDQFQSLQRSSLVMVQCYSYAPSFKLMTFQLDPLRGIFSVLGCSSWRPLQGSQNLVTVSLNCLSVGTVMA